MEQYHILGRIGEGAHGIVFKAKHIEVCYFSLTLYSSKIRSFKKLCLNVLLDAEPSL